MQRHGEILPMLGQGVLPDPPQAGTLNTYIL
jgi:hypothetical protein